MVHFFDIKVDYISIELNALEHMPFVACIPIICHYRQKGGPAREPRGPLYYRT